MNVTCFYDQTPFTLSMEEKIAALRKMQAENLTHYDARCPRCGRVNKVSRERLEMFTPGWEEAIKAPAAAPMSSSSGSMPAADMPAPAMPMTTTPAAVKPKPAAPVRRRHKPAAKKATRKAKPAAKKAAKKPAKKAAKKKPVRKTSKARKKK
ncbi:MAG TPA: hypothetical protein VFH29_06245 [Anaerolineales bacterium]|nr:hypothetical protein [Anaerolineales bacterium]